MRGRTGDGCLSKLHTIGEAAGIPAGTWYRKIRKPWTFSAGELASVIEVTRIPQVDIIELMKLIGKGA